MGTINYNTSRYITIGINPDDYNNENYELNEFIVNDLYDEIKSVLNKYNFYFFHVCIVPGYMVIVLHFNSLKMIILLLIHIQKNLCLSSF